jgi:polar amino acid transport system substrate-binding protein
MFNKGIQFVAVLVLLLFIAATAIAQDNSALKRIVESGTIRVGMSATQPPFTVKSKDGKLIGYEVDLATLLADAMGVEIKFVEKPFSELISALENGDVDVVMSGMTMTPQRNLKVAFVGPYIISGKSILTKSKTVAAIKEAKEIDQANAKLVTLEGSTSQKFVEKFLEKATLTTTKDYDEAIQLVLDDKVNTMIADFPICALTILRYPDAGLVTLAQPLTIEPIGMALPPNDPQFLNMVENYLKALQLSGVLSLLEQKWFEDGAWLIQLP